MEADLLFVEHIDFTASVSSQSSLVDIHSQFLAALESLKTFWDVMDEIDEKTWVLEPEKPPRSATARRIVLGREGGRACPQVPEFILYHCKNDFENGS